MSIVYASVDFVCSQCGVKLPSGTPIQRFDNLERGYYCLKCGDVLKKLRGYSSVCDEYKYFLNKFNLLENSGIGRVYSNEE